LKSTDIYNGYLKLILGLVWSLFKGLQMRRLAAGGGGSMEEGLMKWVREHTEAMGVTPTDFKVPLATASDHTFGWVAAGELTFS
jgi:hypothetical protein